MGLFKSNEAEKQRKEEKLNVLDHMIVSTAFTLDRPFETIGLVHTNHTGTGNIQRLIDNLKSAAFEQGADAIIGFQAMQVKSATNFIDSTAYGTAIRYKKEMQD